MKKLITMVLAIIAFATVLVMTNSDARNTVYEAKERIYVLMNYGAEMYTTVMIEQKLASDNEFVTCKVDDHGHELICWYNRDYWHHMNDRGEWRV